MTPLCIGTLEEFSQQGVWQRCQWRRACPPFRLPHALRLPGDQSEMDSWQQSWKFTSEELTLLRRSPDDFIKRYGHKYGFE
jgi:hypothetical protein